MSTYEYSLCTKAVWCLGPGEVPLALLATSSTAGGGVVEGESTVRSELSEALESSRGRDTGTAGSISALSAAIMGDAGRDIEN